MRYRLRSSSALQRTDHVEGGKRGFAAFVGLAGAGALERLLDRIGRQHAKGHRHSGRRGGGGNAVRTGGRDVFEVRCRATDQAAKTNDRIDPRALRGALRGNRDLERARHAQHEQLIVLDAVFAQRFLGAREQSVGDEVVEPRDHYRDPH